MQKKNVIILFILSILFFSLSLVGVYVYGQTSGVSHHPLEIECKDEFCVRSNGVGIGISSASSRLSISVTGSELTGSAMSNAIRVMAGSLGTTAGNELALASIGFTSTNQEALGIRAYRVTNGSDWTTTAIGLGMDVDNTIRAGGASLWLRANGNVGVGTTNPSQKLEVSGNILGSNLSTAGSVTGGIFYDNDNTSYYVDPAGTTSAILNGTITTKSGYVYIDRPSADSANLILRSGDSSLPQRISISTGRYGNEAIISVPNNDLYFYIGSGNNLLIRGSNGSDNAKLHVNTVYSTTVTAASGTFISGTRSNFKLVLQSDRNMVLYDNDAAIWSTETSISDIRLKKNIVKLDNVLGKILKWNAIRFNWADRLNWGNKKEIGLIAQQVEKDFPEVIYTDKNGYKLINYEKLTPILLQGIKEQQERIEDLEKRLERLERNINRNNLKESKNFWQKIFGM